jgi:CTP:molybdopterin cytidylyltransferase MocA
VVLGAEARQAGALLPTDPTITVVTAEDWDQGLGASLRAGLTAVMAAADEVEAVLVTLVDLPDVAEPVMRRVLERWSADGARPDALLRATYDGRPGHPVLLGRSHWSPLLGTLTGDVGAGPYLTRHLAEPVPCEDLATGRDLDLPEDLGHTVRAVR